MRCAFKCLVHLKIFFYYLSNLGQVPKYFFIVCPALGKSQIIFLAFAQLWASLKLFLYRLPSLGQVSKYFFSVCPASGKFQIIFLAFAQLRASLKLFFYRLPSFGQVPNYFFTVCPALGKSQIIFLTFAQAEQALQFIFRGLLKWNGRGGACVPARTSAQRRFHPQRARSPPTKEASPCVEMFVHYA